METLALLDLALQRLAKLDERKSQVVELRYFGGFTMEEIAEVLGFSVSTVEREWRSARAWIRPQINPMMAIASADIRRKFYHCTAGQSPINSTGL